MSELTLFFSAFLAATIFPFSSEVIFVTAILNDLSFLNAMLYASSGNILAIIVNYWLGYWLYEKTHIKLKSSNIGRKSLYYGHSYGYFILPLSWLPILGDPLTLVAGVLRLNFALFIIIAGFFRIIRYYLLGSMI
ncbi:MAG: DedA family protein [Campylobacterota bacterium]|nr:DedA family protein [Campylobacterota bacterium]